MNQPQFVSFLEKDQHDNPASLVSVNTEKIIMVGFDVASCTLGVTLEDPSSQTRKFKQTVEEPVGTHGKTQKRNHEAFGTHTQNRVFYVRERETIVRIWNAVNGTTETVETFEGFKIHEEEKARFQAAMEQKAKEGKTESKIINPNEHEQPAEGSGRIITLGAQS